MPPASQCRCRSLFAPFCGIGLALAFLIQSGKAIEWRLLFSRSAIPSWLCALTVVGLGLFLAHELLPSQVFDYADDFFSYLVRPVRMQATGTVGGNPFELLGLSDLGPQSFLQAVLQIWLPLDDAYAFDTIFCFLLGICLLAEQGRIQFVPTALIALAIVVYVAINPQIVNISSVYSTSALILALLIATAILLEAWERHAPASRLMIYSIPVGAIAATSVAIKTTTALFVLSFFEIVLGWLLLKQFRVAAMLAVAGVASGAVSVLGWLLTHLDKMNTSLWSSSDRFILDPRLTTWPSVLEAFRDRPTLYGGTRAIYFIGVAALVVALATNVFRFSRRPHELIRLLNIAAMSGGVVSYVGLAAFFNNEAALRYSVPFLIALVPYALFACLPATPQGKWDFAALVQTRPAFWIIGIQVIVVIAFLGVDEVRLSRIVNRHTVVSIPISEQNRAYQARMLSQENRSYLRKVQSMVPAGATIWAWIDAPFELDYARNRVWNYHMDWAVAPWRLNARTAEGLRGELKSRGVQYILWQYRSGFIPNVSTREGYLRTVQWPEYQIILRSAIELSLSLGALATPSSIVWKDDSMEIVALAPR